MRTGPALWLRRSSVAMVAPVLVVIVVLTSGARTGWEYEWGWMLSWAASSTIIVCPIVAGLVAHDRACRQYPTLTAAERSSVRGAWSSLATPLASTIIAMLAWLVGALILAIQAWRHGATGQLPLNVFIEVVVVVLAAAMIGGAVGALMPNRAAGPVAAIGIYGLFIVGHRIGIGEPFAAGGAMDTLAGWRTNPAWLIEFLLIHVAFVIAAGIVVVARTSIQPRIWITGLVSACALLVGTTVAAANAPFHNLFVVSDFEVACVGESPEVCGPSGQRRVMEIGQAALAVAYQKLEGSGLPLRETYVDTHAFKSKPIPEEVGDLEIDASEFKDGKASPETPIANIVTPTLCEAYFDELPPEDLFDAQDTVGEWLEQALSSNTTSRAPQHVIDAYDKLLNCEPIRGVYP